jgi:hypothetical protein
MVFLCRSLSSIWLLNFIFTNQTMRTFLFITQRSSILTFCWIESSYRHFSKQTNYETPHYATVCYFLFFLPRCYKYKLPHCLFKHSQSFSFNVTVQIPHLQNFYSVVCLATALWPPLKWDSPQSDLRIPLSILSTHSFSLIPFSSCLHLYLRLPFTSKILSIFPSITCCRRRFLGKTWPIQLAFLILW